MEQKHVFISHVRNNRRIVQRLYNDLTKRGVEVWLDRNNINPGEDWEVAIRRAIQQGNFFIACFSKQYNEREKTVMNEELTIAIEELRKYSRDRKWFIPVKLNQCEIPDWDIGAGKTLQNRQYVELYKNWDDGVKRIIDVIQPTPVNIQKREINDPYYNQVRLALATGVATKDSSRHMPLNFVIRALEEVSPNEIHTIEKAIITLGLKEYQNEIETKNAVQIILKYLDLTQKSLILFVSIEALGRIGTQEACERIIDFLENLLEKPQEDFPFAGEKLRLVTKIISTLGEMRKPDAIPVLEKAALEYGDFRAKGFVAIYKIGGERAKDALNKILESITDIPNFREEVRSILSEAAEYIEAWEAKHNL